MLSSNDWNLYGLSHPALLSQVDTCERLVYLEIFFRFIDDLSSNLWFVNSLKIVLVSSNNDEFEIVTTIFILVIWNWKIKMISLAKHHFWIYFMLQLILKLYILSG